MVMKTQNVVKNKSFNFSLQIIKLYKKLIDEKEYIIQNSYFEALQVLDQTLKRLMPVIPRKILQLKCLSLQKKHGKPDIGYG